MEIEPWVSGLADAIFVVPAGSLRSEVVALMIQDAVNANRPRKVPGKKDKAELERLRSDPTIKAIADVYTGSLGGSFTLELGRAIKRALKTCTPVMCMRAIRAVADAGETPRYYADAGLAKWCSDNNHSPSYILRPGEVIEKLAMEFELAEGAASGGFDPIEEAEKRAEEEP
jgi:hypothetical protein